jgi:hypothetical protein
MASWYGGGVPLIVLASKAASLSPPSPLRRRAGGGGKIVGDKHGRCLRPRLLSGGISVRVYIRKEIFCVYAMLATKDRGSARRPTAGRGKSLTSENAKCLALTK